MPPWDLITNQFFRLICICAQFLPLYFICRFFFFFFSFLWYFKNWNKRL